VSRIKIGPFLSACSNKQKTTDLQAVAFRRCEKLIGLLHEHEGLFQQKPAGQNAATTWALRSLIGGGRERLSFELGKSLFERARHFFILFSTMVRRLSISAVVSVWVKP
jgi:hypothetical protein